MTKRPSNSRLAAEMYFATRTSDSYITMQACADRYRVALSTVYAVVRDIRRRERRESKP